MSEAYQKNLFDPFTREERSGTNKVQGTGLGMAITKNIVDLMGGSINVESTTGKGTRFEDVYKRQVYAIRNHAYCANCPRLVGMAKIATSVMAQPM